MEWMKFYAIGYNEENLIGISPHFSIYSNCTLRSCHLFSLDSTGRLYASTIAKLLMAQDIFFTPVYLFTIGVNGSGGWQVFGGEVIDGDK